MTYEEMFQQLHASSSWDVYDDPFEENMLKHVQAAARDERVFGIELVVSGWWVVRTTELGMYRIMDIFDNVTSHGRIDDTDMWWVTMMITRHELMKLA